MANNFADFAKASPLPASRLGSIPAINATIERVGTILPTLGNMGPDAAKAFACSTCYLAIKNATADGAKLDMASLYTNPDANKGQGPTIEAAKTLGQKGTYLQSAESKGAVLPSTHYKPT
jgi:hypothetical protein